MTTTMNQDLCRLHRQYNKPASRNTMAMFTRRAPLKRLGSGGASGAKGAGEGDWVGGVTPAFVARDASSSRIFLINAGSPGS
jgi:hypothetical protein